MFHPRLLNIFPVIFLAIFLGGCPATFSVTDPNAVTPKTPREQYLTTAYAYKAALLTFEKLVDLGKIKGDNALKASILIDTSTQALKVAESAVLTGAPNQLALVMFADSLTIQLITLLEAQNGT